MVYRVSYYLKSELNEGKALRHNTEVEASNPEKATLQANIAAIEQGIAEGDFVKHGVYKAKTPAPSTPGYIYTSNEARKYHYAKASSRMCKSCGLVPMAKGMRLCDACKEAAGTTAATRVKKCKDCGAEVLTRRHRCDTCADLRTQACKEAREAKIAAENQQSARTAAEAAKQEKVIYLEV